MPDTSPTHPERVVLTLPGMEQVRVKKDLLYKTVGELELRYDVYYPFDFHEGELRPAIVFIHGEAPPDTLKDAKEWGQYVSWGQLAAASGCIGVTFAHRSSEFFSRLDDVASDVSAMFDEVLSKAQSLGIDANRMGAWMASGGTPVGLSLLLRNAYPFVKCIAVFYGRTNLAHVRERVPDTVSDEMLRFHSPVSYLQSPDALRKIPPLLIARAGQDGLPGVNESIDEFVALALARNLAFELHNQPAGEHGFDILNDDDRSREIVRRTLVFFREHLL